MKFNHLVRAVFIACVAVASTAAMAQGYKISSSDDSDRPGVAQAAGETSQATPVYRGGLLGTTAYEMVNGAMRPIIPPIEGCNAGLAFSPGSKIYCPGFTPVTAPVSNPVAPQSVVTTENYTCQQAGFASNYTGGVSYSVTTTNGVRDAVLVGNTCAGLAPQPSPDTYQTCQQAGYGPSFVGYVLNYGGGGSNNTCVDNSPTTVAAAVCYGLVATGELGWDGAAVMVEAVVDCNRVVDDKFGDGSGGAGDGE